MKYLFIGIIKVYQFCISPVLGSPCRFFPSCSNYAIEAIRQYGVFKGSWLAIKRVVKCHPRHPGGHDPVP